MSAESVPQLTAFLQVVQTVSRSARERGQMGEGNSPIWTEDEWQQFCIAGDAYAAVGGLFADGVAKTTKQVGTMLEDGKDARFIHSALFWLARKAESEDNRDRERDRQKEIDIQRRDREKQIQAEEEKALIRIEANARAKARYDAGAESKSSRRRHAESDL